jgi:hypothetical protein
VWQGVKDTAYAVTHPRETVVGAVHLATDGVYALTDRAFNVSSANSRARRSDYARFWKAFKQEFRSASPLERTGMLTEFGGSLFGGGVAGKGLVFGVKAAGFRRVGGESLNASNHINGLRLKQQLTVGEAKSVFTKSGQLQPSIISRSDAIVPGDRLGAKVSGQLQRIGGNIEDWAKYTTPTISSPSGGFQVHFYKNSVTGKVYYGMDYKSVFNHQGQWNLPPQPHFTYEPPKFR